MHTLWHPSAPLLHPTPRTMDLNAGLGLLFQTTQKQKQRSSGSNQCHTNPFLGSGQSLTRQRLPSHRNEHAHVPNYSPIFVHINPILLSNNSNFYKPSGSNTCHTKPSLGSPASGISIYVSMNRNNTPDPKKKVEPSAH